LEPSFTSIRAAVVKALKGVGTILEYTPQNKPMKRVGWILIVALFVIGMASCDTLSTLPTNTTGVFSLNGSWKMTSTTDNNAMVGTVIQVYPVVGNASIKTLANNTYCMRESDQVWQKVKSNGTGFTISALVGACNGTTTYMDGTISVVNNDNIIVTTRTAGNSELVQKWERVKSS
jgi:hypothetical protein